MSNVVNLSNSAPVKTCARCSVTKVKPSMMWVIDKFYCASCVLDLMDIIDTWLKEPASNG